MANLLLLALMIRGLLYMIKNRINHITPDQDMRAVFCIWNLTIPLNMLLLLDVMDILTFTLLPKLKKIQLIVELRIKRLGKKLERMKLKFSSLIGKKNNKIKYKLYGVNF